MTLEQLITRFIDNPSYMKTGGPKLAKQFNISLELINEAKKQIRERLKIKIKENLIPECDTITLREFGRMIGMDMDSTLFKPEKGVLEFDNEEWEEKVKWVKTKEKSTLLVKKESPNNYQELFQDFLDSYQEEIRISLKPSFKHNSALLVYLSDKHIGAKTKDTSLFPNEWNKEEFSKRMSLVAQEIVRLNELYHFSSIIIMDLGDCLDGMDGFTGSKRVQLPQNMSNREMYSTFMEIHTDFFYILTKYCTENSLAFITAGDSNHGGDFEWICNKSLESVLNLKFPEIETFVGNKFIEHYEFGEHCFIICHGKDSEDMKFPLPLLLDNKTELYFKKYIDYHKIDSKYIHVVKGDLHSASCQYGQFLRYKNVLSMYGSSKWIQTNFMDNTKGVSMDILSENSITEHYLFF